jgi:acylphosphatase
MRRRYRVTGRVQGVGFRVWTARRARELGLRGAVRNEPDGSVVVEGEGEPAALERLEELLRRGPALARVRAVVALPVTAEDLPEDFGISF